MLPLKVELHEQLLLSPPPYSIIYLPKIQDPITQGMTDEAGHSLGSGSVQCPIDLLYYYDIKVYGVSGLSQVLCCLQDSRLCHAWHD